MASQGMAPKLHHCAVFMDMFKGHSFKWLMMVIMDPVDRKTLEDKYRGSVVSKDIAKKIAVVMTTLWNMEQVHGNIRAPNMMINSNGMVKLIDFDQASRDGEVQYLLHISLGLFLDIDGMIGQGEIHKVQDEGIVRKLISLPAPDMQWTLVYLHSQKYGSLVL